MWVILPGWALAPDDYAELAKGLGDDTLVADPWRTPTTVASALRAGLSADGAFDEGPGREPIDLLGHSLGGLAALEWALERPDRIGRLVLLDPLTPHRDAPHRSPTLLQRGARRAFEAIGPVACPAGQALRRGGIRLATGRPDELPASQVRTRYATPESWRFLVDQLHRSVDQENRVARMLDDGAWGPHSPDCLLLVGAASGKYRGFLGAQWELSKRLGARIVMMRGQGHLFPLTRPDLVLRHVAQA